MTSVIKIITFLVPLNQKYKGIHRSFSAILFVLTQHILQNRGVNDGASVGNAVGEVVYKSKE